MRWLQITILIAIVGAAGSVRADALADHEARMIELVKQRKWAGAMVHARAALKLAVKKHGKTNKLIARYHTNIADLALRLAKPNLGLAARHYQLAVDIRAKRLGAGHVDVALTLLSLGPVEEARGKLARAAGHYERALAIFEKTRGPGDGYVGRTLFLLGRVRGKMGKPEVAIPLLERGLAIATRVVGETHKATLENLDYLALEQRNAGRYASALASYRTLLARHKKVAPRSESVAVTAINLGLVLSKLGKLEESTAAYREGLAIAEAIYKDRGSEHATIATALDGLAKVLAERGKYREARELVDRAVAMWQKLRGPEHRDTAVSMSVLFSVVKNMGDYATARPLAEKVLAIFTRTYGRQHAETAVAIDNLASVLADLGHYKRAEALYREAYAIHQKTRGAEHPVVATSANNIGWLLRMTGRPRASLPFYERALAIHTRVSGPGSHAAASAHGQLGLAHLALGDLKKARAHLEKARAINKKVLGDAHPDLAFIVASLARVEEAAGRRARARALSERSLAIAERHLEPLLYATSQRERLELVGQHRRKVHMVLSMFDRRGDARAAYEKVLRWKAIVLTSMIAQRQTLLAHSDRKLAARLDELAAVRTELANLAMAVPEPGKRAGVNARLRALGRKKDRLERQLSRRSAEFSAGQRAAGASFRGVCRSLDRKSALVDYVRYVRTSGSARAWHLTAFVTTGGACKRPARIELGPAAAIDKAIRAYRVAVENNEDSDSIIALASRVRKRIWDPVAAALEGRDRIFVSTDGSLNGVPFGGLAKGRTFLLEDYTFSYVPNGASLLRGRGKSKRRAGEALLVGGVVYDARAGAARGRTRSGGCGVGSRPAYKYLPGTRAEAEALAPLLGKGVKSLVGTAADEATVKKLLPASRVVHLATHGFFARPCNGAAAASTDVEVASYPLVRSGIVLAGANSTRGAMVVDGEDGVLTAEEVAELDLRAVDLAVLSACETGLGDVRDGEGVLGLRWAFDIAGARALVMSLWQVPDEETRQLMVAFYQRFGGKAGAAEALRAAQLEMLRRRRAEGDPRPWSWSAFIVSGR